MPATRAASIFGQRRGVAAVAVAAALGFAPASGASLTLQVPATHGAPGHQCWVPVDAQGAAGLALGRFGLQVSSDSGGDPALIVGVAPGGLLEGAESLVEGDPDPSVLPQTRLALDFLADHALADSGPLLLVQIALPPTAHVGDRFTVTPEDPGAPAQFARFDLAAGPGEPSYVSGTLDVVPLAPGDLDGDGQVTVADVTAAVRAILGLGPTLSDAQQAAADVAPVPGAGPRQGQAYGDGRVDILDVLRILRRAIGLDTGPWP